LAEVKGTHLQIARFSAKLGLQRFSKFSRFTARCLESVGYVRRVCSISVQENCVWDHLCNLLYNQKSNGFLNRTTPFLPEITRQFGHVRAPSQGLALPY